MDFYKWITVLKLRCARVGRHIRLAVDCHFCASSLVSYLLANCASQSRYQYCFGRISPSLSVCLSVCIPLTRWLRSRSRLRIRTADRHDLRNVMGISLSKDTSVKKYSWRSSQCVSEDVSWIVEKCPISQCWRILKKFLDPDLEADDVQNLISSSYRWDFDAVLRNNVSYLVL